MKISDPIYGIIEVPYIFHPIIESKDFVRLRSIQQVHFSDLLSEKGFNRYNHSIGVFYLSKIFLDHIKEEIILNDSDILHFLLAALFHDICHLPYGYVLEGYYGISHEKLLDKYFETHFQNELSEVEDISGVDIDIKRITKIIQCKSKRFPDTIYETLLKGRLSLDRLEKGRLSLDRLEKGRLSLDRLDYVLRDSYDEKIFSDPSRIISIINLMPKCVYIQDNKVHLKKEGCSNNKFKFFYDRIRKANELTYLDWKVRLKYKCFYELLPKLDNEFNNGLNLLKYDDLEFIGEIIKNNRNVLISGEKIDSWINTNITNVGYDVVDYFNINIDILDSLFKVLPTKKNRKTIDLKGVKKIERKIVDDALSEFNADASYHKMFSRDGMVLLDIPPYPRTIELLYYKDFSVDRFFWKIFIFTKKFEYFFPERQKEEDIVAYSNWKALVQKSFRKNINKMIEGQI